jgi:hypothetical protein
MSKRLADMFFNELKQHLLYPSWACRSTDAFRRMSKNLIRIRYLLNVFGLFLHIILFVFAIL